MQRKGSRNLPLGNPLILLLNCKVKDSLKLEKEEQ